MTPAKAGPLTKLRQDYEAAYARGDSATLASYFTEDAVFMPPEGPTCIGRADIRSYYQTYFAQFQGQLSTTEEESANMGSWSIGRGEFQGALTPRSGGEPILISGKWMNVNVVQPDGSLRIARHIWNLLVPIPGR